MPFERARTLLSQGESLRRARRPAAAREPLRHALIIFRSLGAQPWITRAVTELGAAGVRGSPTDRTGDGTRLDELTPQELQIARAVGRGLNNVEAAAALFVSRKTVEAHLTRAYRKLGVRSRTELTRMLLAHDAARSYSDRCSSRATNRRHAPSRRGQTPCRLLVLTRNALSSAAILARPPPRLKQHGLAVRDRCLDVMSQVIDQRLHLGA
jgi:DNA-binding CsgD family transcriptional regulator